MAERLKVNPTRRELIGLKRRKKIADGIIEILHKDLDVLILHLLEQREKAFNLRNILNDTFKTEYKNYIDAEMMIGSKNLKLISKTITLKQPVIERHNSIGVLGMEFPAFKINSQQNSTTQNDLNMLRVPISIGQTSLKMRDLMNLIVELASLAALIRQLLEIILLKKRQINGIQFKKIPQINATIKYIENILEDIEHQDAIRVRVLQRKRKEKKERNYGSNTL